MEMQALKDSSGPVFTVTDLLRGVQYFLADKDSHYEIEVLRKAGYAKVAVSRKADVLEVADELIRLLDNADQLCSTSGASAKSSSPKGLEEVNESFARHNAYGLNA